MKAEAFDDCGRILWYVHAATWLASFLATTGIVTMQVRHGSDHYFSAIWLLGYTIIADIYLVIASGIAAAAYYPDRPRLSKWFLLVVIASAILAILSAVALVELPRHF